MRLRLLLTSVLVAVVTVGPTWVSLQPLLGRSLGELSGFLFALDFLVSTLAVYVVLHFTLGRPIARIEETVRAIAPADAEGGAVLLRLDRALRRLALDLGEERRVNQRRLEALAHSNEALVKLQAELVANDRLATVGKLAAGVAHEVGNPLSGILGYLSVLRMRRGADPELVDVIGRIDHEVKRIDQIVRALLELGRPSRGRAQPLDVRPVVDSCVRLIAASRELEAVRVEVEGPPALWLCAEPGPLSQALVNLLLNAAQAMDGKGRVVVRLEPGEGGGRIVVEDEGPGLAPDVKAHLFEVFFTTKAAGKGTGLGLAVSRHLLAQFEGRLEAGDRPGGGARFTITLPSS